MKSKWICIVGLSAILLQGANASAQFGFFSSGPKVKEVSTEQLARLQAAQAEAEKKAIEAGQQPPAAKFVIVDVRSPVEYRVSTIPGALTKQQYESNRKAYVGKTVIPYCTIGGRSTKYAKQLASKGVKVLNYKESILGWCEKRLPLVGPDGQATNIVHTASSRYRVPSNYKAVW